CSLGRSSWSSTSRPSPTRERWSWGWRSSRSPRGLPSSSGNAGRRTFWVAVFIAQQFLQNVLGYSTLEAGLSVLPLGGFMVLTTPLSARLVETRGARLTLLTGYVFCLLGFLTMLLLWKE